MNQVELVIEIGKTLDGINQQIKALESAGLPPGAYDVHQIQLPDGSYPMVPLLHAKAQCLHALTYVTVVVGDGS